MSQQLTPEQLLMLHKKDAWIKVRVPTEFDQRLDKAFSSLGIDMSCFTRAIMSDAIRAAESGEKPALAPDAYQDGTELSFNHNHANQKHNAI
jgi:hypothetical protein